MSLGGNKYRKGTDRMNEPAIEYLSEVRLLDGENQLVSVGAAQLYPSLHAGEFFPRDCSGETLKTIPTRAARLQTKDGRCFPMPKVDRLCEGKNKPAHFHFDYHS
jgi:hypothetical protein